MRIEFEVPKWAYGKHIHIFAGAELLGNKECRIVHEDGEHVVKYLPLKIKQESGRCNGCGICCESSKLPVSLVDKMLEAITTHEGDSCEFLGDNGCILGAFIPFSCVRSVMTNLEGCSEKLTEV
jgi:hypothetical protein